VGREAGGKERGGGELATWPASAQPRAAAAVRTIAGDHRSGLECRRWAVERGVPRVALESEPVGSYFGRFLGLIIKDKI
jgi:hypothetical protein